MVQSLNIELTPADIMVLTDLIYEQAPRLWINGEWYCPNSLEPDSETSRLVQSYYDSARNDQAAAESLAPRESLAQEHRSEKNHQCDAQLVDRRDSRRWPNL